MAKRTAISPTRAEDYPQWYQQVIQSADLAEASPVRGCMIIKPNGYAIWENMQRYLDNEFKKTGCKNAYFPLLIPLAHLQKEADHIEGFAKECAVVTHSRLESNEEGQLIPCGKLEEPYIIRPTSETLIGTQFAKWIQSYRDLPLKINQWANVMRWEMRTRLFLRTSEFLWQEGHTAHASADEALDKTKQMLGVYADFAENILAIPVIQGEKTPEERFPGANNTYTIEAMMQDGKALQLGTSHFLGQTFSKSFDIRFSDQEGSEQHAWTTSWGVTTRLIGALIMTHSDDNGLVIPPRIAPTHIVILPIARNEEDKASVMAYCKNLQTDLQALSYHQLPLIADIDDRDMNGGEKTWQHIKQGTPIRLEVGPRDVANNAVFMGRRDLEPKDKQSLSQEELLSTVTSLLDEMQENIYQRALGFHQQRTEEIDSLEAFKTYFEDRNREPGFAKVFSSADESIEAMIKPLKVTARCIPLEQTDTEGTCIFTGQPTRQKVVYAKSY